MCAHAAPFCAEMAPDATPDPRRCKTLCVFGRPGGGEGKRAVRKRRGGAGTQTKRHRAPEPNTTSEHSPRKRTNVRNHPPIGQATWLGKFGVFWFFGLPGFWGSQRSEKQQNKKTHAAPNTTQTSPTHSETGPVFLWRGGGDNLPTCTFMCGRTHPLGMVLPAPDTHVCAFSLLHRGLLRALLLQATPAQVLPLFSLSLNPGPFFRSAPPTCGALHNAMGPGRLRV